VIGCGGASPWRFRTPPRRGSGGILTSSSPARRTTARAAVAEYQPGGNLLDNSPAVWDNGLHGTDRGCVAGSPLRRRCRRRHPGDAQVVTANNSHKSVSCCPERGILADFDQARLSPETREIVAQHVSGCAFCQSVLAEL